jgi:hypothetical protein
MEDIMATLLSHGAGSWTGLVPTFPALPLLVLIPCIGLAGCGQASGSSNLDRRLVGTWYWETSTYLSDYGLIKSTSTVTIAADNTFRVREEGTRTGVQTYAGRVVQEGNSLIATTDSGQTHTYRFALSGSNGLWLGNRLYERR